MIQSFVYPVWLAEGSLQQELVAHYGQQHSNEGVCLINLSTRWVAYATFDDVHEAACALSTFNGFPLRGGYWYSRGVINYMFLDAQEYVQKTCSSATHYP